MNFEDEDYRRLYVRRTVTSKRLGWEGRAVRNEMLTEFDRAGIWEFTEDAAADIAELIDMPLDVVQVGLERLLATKTWILGEGGIVWPNYVEAQNCARSDRIRQQESRDRRRAEAMAKTAKSPAGVTERHTESQPSQIVTPPSLPSSTSLPPERELSEPAEPSSTEPGTHDRIPKTWQPSEEFYSEALVAGVTRAGLDESVKYWRGRKLGGDFFSPEDFFRGKFASVRTHEEKTRFVAHLARGSPTSRGSHNPRASKQPNAGLTGFESLKEPA